MPDMEVMLGMFSGIEGRHGMYAWYGSNSRDVSLVLRKCQGCESGIESMLSTYIWNGGNSARDVCLVGKDRYRCLSGITGTLLMCTYIYLVVRELYGSPICLVWKSQKCCVSGFYIY
jgi:hypothetical protein